MTSSLDPSATEDAQPALVPDSPAIQGEMPNRLQFSLSSLLILTALVAVGMVLLKNFGHWGLVAITAASFVFTIYALDLHKFVKARLLAKAGQANVEQSKEAANSSSLRILVDMIWGIGLPLLCFSYDPGIFNHEVGKSTFGDTVIFMALWQMVLLLAWLTIGPKGPVWNGFLAGGLLVGALMAGMIAIPLTPVAFIFSLTRFGFGLPGLVPLMTMCVFARNWIRSTRLFPNQGEMGSYGYLAMVSILLAFLAPLMIVTISNSLGLPLHFPKVSNAAHLSLFD
jgi:hypothetical protein